MQTAGRQRPATRSGFTLVELLLAVGLLVLLLSAVVFNFSSLQRGVALEEGTTQLEALLRFARAHAAQTGRLVEIRFEEEFDDAVTTVSGKVHVVWEPDPLIRPGYFEDLPDARPYVQALSDAVHIDRVRPWPVESGNEDPASPRRLDPETEASAGGSVGSPQRSGADGQRSSDFWPIRFYPDGSADSVEIILGSMDEDDTRAVTLEFMGLTGTFRRHYVAAEFSATPMDEGSEKGQNEKSGEPAPFRVEP